MKSGRELDALIAEKVFGDTWMNEYLALERESCADTELAITENRVPRYAGELNVRAAEALIKWKHYSTDIAAAWEVVEKLKDETMSVSIFTTHVHGPEETQILIDGVEMCRGDFSIPHAICRAALKAVGEAI